VLTVISGGTNLASANYAGLLRFESATMSFGKILTIEAAIDLVLSDHFENCQNPHETIHKIWLLLNADAPSSSELNKCLVRAERKYH
jgi:hypothetical protein